MPDLVRGDRECIELEVETPPGFTMEDPGRYRFEFTVSRYTARVVAAVPVWPEARLVAVVTDPFGRVAIRGLPAIPGERVVVSATKDHRTGTAEPVRLARSITEVLAFVTLPPEANEPHGYRGPGGSVPV